MSAIEAKVGGYSVFEDGNPVAERDFRDGANTIDGQSCTCLLYTSDAADE